MRPISGRARRTGSRKNRSAPAYRWDLRARRRHSCVRGREESAQFQNSAERLVKRGLRASVLVGIDTGGTFTDLVATIGGDIPVHKVLSTPADPADAVIPGLREMLVDT